MKIKFNKKTFMFEVVDNIFGTVIDHFSNRLDEVKFKKRNF